MAASLPPSTLSLAPVLRETDRLNDALRAHVQLMRTNRQDERNERVYARIALLAVVGGVVAYFATSIYSQRVRHPVLFRWWERMRREPVQGDGAHNFSMYQVTTAGTYHPVQTMMNFLMWWSSLRFESAQFLMMTVEYFERKASDDPTKRLTSLHWCGSAAQTQYAKLVGEHGAASAGCSVVTLEQRRQTLVDNWNASKDWNIWYALLPQPTDSTGVQRFLSLPIIRELYTDSEATGGAANACDGSSFFRTGLGMLFEGGLCHVAFQETATDLSAAELFSKYFGESITVRPLCDAARAAGALDGGMTVGMMAVMAGAMAGGPVTAVVAGVALGGVGAYVGSEVGGNAAAEECERENAA